MNFGLINDFVQPSSGFLIPTVATLLLGFLIYKLCYAPYQVLKKSGIKGLPPVPIVGNHLVLAGKDFNAMFDHIYKKYSGPLTGFYLGRTPCIMLRDPELIKQVTVKEFDAFIDRPKFIQIVPEKYGFKGLLVAKGDTWRDMRHSLTPSFSASKMKMMVPLIKRDADTLVQKFEEKAKSGESINVVNYYSEYTLETILAAAFGRVVNLQKGEADEVTKAARGVFDSFKRNIVKIAFLILTTLPFMEKPVQFFIANFTDIAESWKVLHKTALALVEARRSGAAKPPKYKDMLQLMIDASDENAHNGADKSTKASAAAPTGCPMHQANGTAMKHKLSSQEIVDNSVVFLIAGFETTANSISYSSYYLALNPDIQEKLQSEIDNYFEDNPEATLYEASQEITYLDNVIQEALRLIPPATIGSRQCVKTVTVDGHTIPEGAQVFFPILCLHQDPKYWTDPEKYDPDRFSAEEKAKRPNAVHLPFGIGPRNCIGMRFALLEAKIALIELLKRFNFVRAPETEVPLTFTGLTRTPKNGIHLRVTPRE